MHQPEPKRGEKPKTVLLSLAAVLVIVLLFLINTALLPDKSTWQLTSPTAHGSDGDLRQRYLAAVRDSIVGVHLETPSVGVSRHRSDSELKQQPFDAKNREIGRDWPLFGLSMIGVARMNNVWKLLEEAILQGIKGSFVECGVWRGGGSIFAKAVLTAYGEDREVHLIDSFQGLPPNTTTLDEGFWSDMSYLRVPLEKVKAGFQRFQLLDDNVFFHKGYFRYSLAAWRAQGIGPIAVLRMDGDMYESTIDQLYNLWDAVSPGGFIIVDDWSIDVCKQALEEFFERNKMQPTIEPIDKDGIYFRKPDARPIDHEWYASFNASRSTADAEPTEKA